MLEERLGPATVTWNGAGSNNRWSNADNWDRDPLTNVARVPQAGDDVLIPDVGAASAEVLFDISVAGSAVALNSLTSDGMNPVGEPFRMTFPTLTLDGTGPFKFGGLILSGGTLAGASTVTVVGPFTWSGGMIAGTGTTPTSSSMPSAVKRSG